MNKGADTPTLPEGLPDDWVLDRDVHCPNCKYNLRMLRAPRCPECGTVFRWQTVLSVHCPRCNEALYTVDGGTCPHCKLELRWERLLEDASRIDRRLYEYTDKPIRAGIRTAFAVLRPWRFWRSMSLETPPIVGRLRRLRWTAIVVCAIGISLALFQTISAHSWPLVAALEHWLRYGELLVAPAIVLTLPIVTLLLMPRFTPTLARCRVRQDQLLRLLALASLGLAWIGVYLVVSTGLAFLINGLGTPLPPGMTIVPEVWLELSETIGLTMWPDPTRWTSLTANGSLNYWYNAAALVVFLVVGFIWWWRFLFFGLRDYLRFDRENAWALFLSTQIIGLLVIAIVLAGFTPLGEPIGRLLIAR